MVAQSGEIAARLADGLARARSVFVLTGAGVSAESGVPTFRDAMTGLWARFDPLERAAVAAATPNAGHRAIAAIERRVPVFLLATQNVDGLHQRAGSRRMVELHGSLARVRCSREDRIVESWSDPAADEPPRCQRCGAFLRPDVVWFEEALPAEALDRAEAAARACDLMIVAGTSAEVHPAASLPWLARESGATIVEVNPVATPMSRLADHVVRSPSGVALPAWVSAAWPDDPDPIDGGGAK